MLMEYGEVPSTISKEAFRADPDNWENYWPGFTTYTGIIGRLPSTGIQIVRNRQNPHLYKAFQTIYREMRTPEAAQEDPEMKLVASLDRAGVMRPTCRVQHLDGTVRDHEDWKTNLKWHFDLNPWVWTGVVKEQSSAC